jgi:cytochrome c oxidase subunit 2
LQDHIGAILDGWHDTATVAFARLLSDADIAALITFKRRAWGNQAGDVVQPGDIAVARKNSEI